VEPLLNLEQAGELLGLTKSQMFELTRARSQTRQRLPVPVIRIGRHCRFSPEALKAWVTKLENGS
jgi:predicted DNA-binding transcriptional regulator AlpA